MATKKKTAPVTAELEEVITPDATEKVDLTNTTTGDVRISDSAIVNVRSNVFGELIFIDPVTQEQVSWMQCGEIQQLPMGTLRHMKTGASKFFTNQMVVITGFADENAEKYTPADIYKSLYITQYYRDFLDPADYNGICTLTEAQIKDKVSLLTQSARQKLVIALNTYIEKGVLDSLRTIKAYEKALGCDLTRPE